MQHHPTINIINQSDTKRQSPHNKRTEVHYSYLQFLVFLNAVRCNFRLAARVRLPFCIDHTNHILSMIIILQVVRNKCCSTATGDKEVLKTICVMC